MSIIRRLSGLEILDSRGRPTVQATCELESGAVGTASVPSGASTGAAEARELRDGDPGRYGGFGCRMAVRNVNETLNTLLAGRAFGDQEELDRALLDADGTEDKSRLGANALLAVSLAFCRAQALERSEPLYRQMACMLGEADISGRLPRPAINLFSGGKHAGGQVPLQDVLVVPIAASTMDEALAMTYAVYQAAAAFVGEQYGMRLLTADEGGLAPPFESIQAMLDATVASIEAAGYVPGNDVALAIDVASSHFFRDGRYHLGEVSLDGSAMVRQLVDWLDRYPILSIEDGLAEEDWTHWPELRAAVGGRALVVGDDLLCTNPGRIRRAVEAGAADALLLKVNQVGTLTEAAEAYRLAREAGWQVIVSARSGETEDNWLADLAVGWQGDQIKIGSITQSERLAKYNRLLQIEAGTRMPLASLVR